ncbi:hypothetical protein ABDK00_017765 [Niabella insulamsoli]|uniref:hypothetical protein n=1 Tax=Niabella insulamsoli TaxID=3144874 RepID=UPI0031FD3E88
MSNYSHISSASGPRNDAEIMIRIRSLSKNFATAWVFFGGQVLICNYSMFKKLKQKWGVGPLQLTLILFTFAVGGSLSGYAGRWLMSQWAPGNRLVYSVLYIICVTLIWPFMVLLVSVPLGQYAFFKKYLGSLFNKLFRRRKIK